MGRVARAGGRACLANGERWAKSPKAESSPLTQYGGLKRPEALCEKSYIHLLLTIHRTSSEDIPHIIPTVKGKGPMAAAPPGSSGHSPLAFCRLPAMSGPSP